LLDQEIIRQRLYNQHILMAQRFTQPGQLVSWMGAIQAQDYPAAKWGIGLRLPGTTEGDIEKVIAERSIVRTWALRGTLHLLAAADIRWVLALIRRSVIARHGPYNRRLGLDEAVFAHSRAVMEKALHGCKLLTRKELAAILEENKIPTHELRMNFLLYRAALDGVICFGPLRGKQETITLLEEWLPLYPEKSREEALAEMAIRFFVSHGPATVKDFAWWSGLPAVDVKTAFELVKSELTSTGENGNTYWQGRDNPPAAGFSLGGALAPYYDEYLAGYADRQALLHPKIDTRVDMTFGLLNPTILIGGRIAGDWKRTFEKRNVVITCQPYYEFGEDEIEEVEGAARRFADFLGMLAVVKIKDRVLNNLV
jgi:hypothetical protein